MYISYSGFKSFSDCPFQYYNRYVNKTKIPPENRINMLFGQTVGVLFEHFYAHKLWKRSDYLPYMVSQAKSVLNDTIAIETKKGGKIDWEEEAANYHDYASLLRDVEEAVPRGLQVIREHRFIGLEAGTEVSLDSSFGPHKIGGRADFVIRRVAPHGDLVIMDGKGSKHGGKYVEDKQLLWYAMLHREKLGVIPDKLGFIFWRFSGADAVAWLPFTPTDLDRLLDEILANLDRIEASNKRLRLLEDMPRAREDARQEVYPAQSGPNKCKLCSYNTVCEDGKRYLGKKDSSRRGSSGVLNLKDTTGVSYDLE